MQFRGDPRGLPRLSKTQLWNRFLRSSSQTSSTALSSGAYGGRHIRRMLAGAQGATGMPAHANEDHHDLPVGMTTPYSLLWMTRRSGRAQKRHGLGDVMGLLNFAQWY